MQMFTHLLKMFKLAIALCAVSFTCALPTIPTVDPRIDPNGSWRVVGGTDAADGAFPFMASLRSTSNSHFCGGTILNTLWILTAAHCLTSHSAENTIVVVGTNTLNSGGVTYSARKLTIHANYNTTTIANDIGVIRLSNALTFSTTVGPVGLNTADTEVVAATLIGWGRTSTNSGIPNKLQQLSTSTITYASCRDSWGSGVSANQICAVIRAGQGACNGDSGGPLLQSSNNAQLGLASFIRSGGCAQGFPDIYTRVSSYITWIEDVVAS